jgi:hypothetical protein
MLDPVSRIAIVALSGLCATWAFTSTPARARDAAEFIAAIPHVSSAAATSAAVAPVAIVRDPFATPTASQIGGNVPPLAGNGKIEPLPSNLASDIIPAMPGTGASAGAPSGGARVTAVVTGLHPYAMVEVSGIHAIKGIGDRVGGVPVVAIDLDGIRLANGARIAVDMGANAR